MPQTLDQLKAAAKAAQLAADKAQQEADAEANAVANPRNPDVVLGDILDEIGMRLGNRPRYKALVAEFKATYAPPPEPAPAKS